MCYAHCSFILTPILGEGLELFCSNHELSLDALLIFLIGFFFLFPLPDTADAVWTHLRRACDRAPEECVLNFRTRGPV